MIPLSSSSRWIASLTALTWARTSAGGSLVSIASSFLSSAVSRRSSSSDGADVTETTICFAIAVVMQLGQLRLSASATLIGMIRSLCPTTRTSWKETARVVQASQLASAYAEFSLSTGSPPDTVTSE